MKKTLLTLITLSVVTIGFSQQKDIIAASGQGQTSIDFQDFRFVDMKGVSDQIISKKNMEIPDQVVGMTYDKKNQTIVFVGMHSPDVYTYDMNTQQYQRIYASGKAHSKCAIGEQFSRMGTASNGISYALNNNSTQLLEILPMKNGFAVKELGALSSDISLNHQKFFGGDLIADNAGNLYLISAYSNVVKINPKNMSATFMGTISGLEKGFTTNGSAVMSDGNVLLSNAQGKGFYTLNFDNLKAEKMHVDYTTPVYDLASPYLLKDAESLAVANNFVSVYPTKVTNREISVSVNNKIDGMGNVSIYDFAGNELIKTKMNLADALNSKTIPLNNLSPGNYFIKVVDYQGRELINTKFILLR
ncbi:MAG: T9SS type A sorting domain-containing protein [Flavobacteriaceae bacterium]|nr:T9SS type A sorting domain-containing protein [Flavobacteriaceae bacterium]